LKKLIEVLLLPALLLISLTSPVSGLNCGEGECFDCRYCDGDCDNCRCDEGINCCCSAPPGYYAFGEMKFPCPGGTFGVKLGMSDCQLCPDMPTYEGKVYNVSIMGAYHPAHCERALCNPDVLANSGAPGSGSWPPECESPKGTYIRLTSKEQPFEFCDSVGIDSKGCKFSRPKDAAERRFGDIRQTFGLQLTLFSALFAAGGTLGLQSTTTSGF